MLNNNDAIISVEGLWKKYGVENPKLIEKIENLNRIIYKKARTEPFWAIRDVSFFIKKGETFGIIGRNGAGKSTLLKILSGVTPPSRGKIDIRGTIFPMIELNAGMHLDFTGRENVYLLGTIMGLSKERINSIMGDIEAFCELGEWFDQPVRHYSSGMTARLGFSVGVNVNADILIIDEVLSVGDYQFQKKCFDRIERIKQNGTTIIFVSHALRVVERICSRILYLDSGVIKDIGKSEKVIEHYLHDSFKETHNFCENNKIVEDISGTGEIIVTDVSIINEAGETTDNIHFNDKISVKIEYFAKEKVIDPIFSIGFHTPDMVMLFYVSNIKERIGKVIEGKGSITYTFMDFPLNQGVFGIKIGIALRDGRVAFKRDSIKFFMVIADASESLDIPGLFVPKFKWDY